MIEKKTTLQLRQGDRILWTEHDLGNGRVSRHDSGTVVSVEYDKEKDGVLAKVVCTRERFNAGINAVYDVKSKEGL
jgi:hypothetical protein